MIKEFKEFITRGNVIDLAVGVVMGSAFTAIVNANVEGVFMPIISIITGGIDFSAWKFALTGGENPAMLDLGTLVAAIINFLLIGLVLFLLIQSINKFRRTREAEPVAEPRICPYCPVSYTHLDVYKRQVDMKERGLLAKNTLVGTVMSNLGLDIAMREHGINLVKTDVGDRYVLEEMLKSGYNLGGEQSGHVIFLDHNTTRCV